MKSRYILLFLLNVLIVAYVVFTRWIENEASDLSPSTSPSASSSTSSPTPSPTEIWVAPYNYIDRLNYYTKSWKEKNITLFLSEKIDKLDSNELIPDKIYISSKKMLSQINRPDVSYYSDYNEILSSKKNFPFLLRIGDSTEPSPWPFFSKARKVGDENAILLKLDKIRHWDILKDFKDPVTWDKKINDVIWRGASTGYIEKGESLRGRFVKKYFGKYNVGFDHIVQDQYQYTPYQKSHLGISGLLEFKFIVSLEGNDVATNLKWILLSNSVVIMPKPRFESWLMEGLLVPFVHYVPLNDNLDNLSEILEFCEKNDRKMREIAENGKEWMKMFFDEETEMKLDSDIVDIYAKNVIIT